MTINRRSFISTGCAAAAAFRLGPIWAKEPVRGKGLRVLAECDNVFLGASAFAVAAASRNPSQCVIVERNLSPAAEFSGALLPNVLSPGHSEAARDILGRIESEGLASRGLCHTPPVSDVVCAFAIRRKINIFFNAEITAIRPTAGGYELRVIGSDGHSALRCRRIVDTTPCAWRDAGVHAIKAKFLSAALIGRNNADLSRFSARDWELHPGALEGETYFRIRLPRDAGWTAARLRLHDAFGEFSSSAGNIFKMGAEATEFGYEYGSPDAGRQIGKDWQWIPGARYPDLASAIDGGASWS